MSKVIIRSLPGINRCMLGEPAKNSTTPVLQTEGVNIKEMWKVIDCCEDVPAGTTKVGDCLPCKETCIPVAMVKGLRSSCDVGWRDGQRNPVTSLYWTLVLNASSQYGYALDVNKIYSNDIGAIRKCYGVEAARGAIMREVSGVFKVYGIAVDMRHLSLIADYMVCASRVRHGG